MISTVREHLSRATTQLAAVNRSLNCDPIEIAKEKGFNIPNFKTKKEILKLKKFHYKRLDVKNEINERKGEASEMIKLYVNATKDFLRNLPFGISWLMKVIQDYILLMFNESGGSGGGSGSNGSKYSSEWRVSIANGSTVVDISITLITFKPVSLSLSRSPLF